MRSVFIALCLGMGIVVAASPAATASITSKAASVSTAAAVGTKAPVASKAVAAEGDCPQECWNESAASANCDPNTDDVCLCGPFFDAVTSCTGSTCSEGENLQVLNTLETACDV